VASLVAIPYIVKPLWAPLVDWLGTRKQWIVACQVGIGLLILVLALRGTPPALTPLLWVVLIGIAALSATQDIAADAYTIELLDERELGPANGMRVTAYRVALLTASGALVAASEALGWPRVFTVAAAVMFALAVVTLAVPTGQRAPAAAAHEPLWQPVSELLRLPGAWAVALFVLTFKLGDLSLQPMIQPFWVDSGYGPAQIGVVNSVAIGATVAGALLGGLLTARLGTFRALWMLGAVQALSNLGYYAAAVAGAPAALMYTAAVVEQFTQGLGTAAFLTFLMALCDKRYAATQYALLSALFRLSGAAASWFSGDFARDLGYATYFLATFALALPAFALLPFVRRRPLSAGAVVEH
jgi:PAT family beta-lactamase induction signal transducer AmpG